VEILHRIANMDRETCEPLKALGFNATHGLGSLLMISESHPAWPEARVIIEKLHGVHVVTTEFTKAERAGAQYLAMGGAWGCGYPQPESDFGYQEVTYDLSRCCPVCSVGKVQKAPFRMRREPGWSKRNIVQLTWVDDEYFVKPEIWEKVFKPFGIGCRPVIHHRDDKELKSVVQLDISETADAPLELEGCRSEACPAKGHIKYHGVSRGFFPPFRSPQKAPILKSQEWFGSGGSAGKSVFASSDLYRAMREHKVRLGYFWPLASSKGS